MATTYIHTRMGVIDANGDTNILYPQNTAIDVSVSRANNSEIPSSVATIQQLADSLAASAFAIPIDDTSTSSTTKSWSANKINSELTALNSNLVNISPKILWHTDSPNYTSAGEKQLHVSGKDYKFYRLIYRFDPAQSTEMSQDFIKGKGCLLNTPASEQGMVTAGRSLIFMRKVTASSSSSVTFSDAGYKIISSDNTFVSANGYLVPTYILGYNAN